MTTRNTTGAAPSDWISAGQEIERLLTQFRTAIEPIPPASPSMIKAITSFIADRVADRIKAKDAELQAARAQIVELRAVLLEVSAIGDAYVYPKEWDAPAMGGGPSMEDFDRVKLGDICEDVLGATSASYAGLTVVKADELAELRALKAKVDLYGNEFAQLETGDELEKALGPHPHEGSGGGWIMRAERLRDKLAAASKALAKARVALAMIPAKDVGARWDTPTFHKKYVSPAVEAIDAVEAK